jgi:regulator of protease activity HflC (stomatin/prohibitin superfamily)
MADRTTEFAEAAGGIAWVASRLATVALAVIALSVLLSSYSIVAPGYTGVVFNIWTGSLRTVCQGLVFRIPWVTCV